MYYYEVEYEDKDGNTYLEECNGIRLAFLRLRYKVTSVEKWIE